MATIKTPSAAQWSMWPSVRQGLVKAYGSLNPSEIIHARSASRLNGLDQAAMEDTGWQVEAFLAGDWDSAEPDVSLRHPGLAAKAFLDAGLDWTALSPAVFDECMERLEHWQGSRYPHFGSAAAARLSCDPAIAWASVASFLILAGPGPLGIYQKFGSERIGRINKLFNQIYAKPGLLGARAESGQQYFDKIFGSGAWSPACGRLGTAKDCLARLMALAESSTLDSMLPPGQNRAGRPRM